MVHIWAAFANRHWPSHYLMGAARRIRSQHAGEGRFARIVSALAIVSPGAGRNGLEPAASQPPIGNLRDEDHPGAVCFRTTPDLQSGYNRSALGKREGFTPRDLHRSYGCRPPMKLPGGVSTAPGRPVQRTWPWPALGVRSCFLIGPRGQGRAGAIGRPGGVAARLEAAGEGGRDPGRCPARPPIRWRWRHGRGEPILRNRRRAANMRCDPRLDRQRSRVAPGRAGAQPGPRCLLVYHLRAARGRAVTAA